MQLFGNGMSLIVFTGIVAGVPSAVGKSYTNVFITREWSPIQLAVVLAMMIAVVALIVLVEMGERRIPVHYARRTAGAKATGSQATHMPLKVNAGGVTPLSSPRRCWHSRRARSPTICGATVAYSRPPPRPLYVGLLRRRPDPALILEGLNVRFAFGGTSLLIVIGVAMDTINQIEAQLALTPQGGIRGSCITKASRRGPGASELDAFGADVRVLRGRWRWSGFRPAEDSGPYAPAPSGEFARRGSR